MEIARVREVANAYHVYQQLLLENNALDFGDLINYTLKLSPYLDSDYDITQTSTTIVGVSGGIAKQHVFVDDCNYCLSIHASATAAYASGAVTFIVHSKER